MKKYFLALLFLLPFFVFADDAPITVTSQQPQFIITLPGNPTTGYSWLVSAYNGRLIKALSSSYQENNHPAGMVGVSGTFTFTFEVLSAAFNTPQSTTVTFIYTRPWIADKTDAAEEKKYTVNIVK